MVSLESAELVGPASPTRKTPLAEEETREQPRKGGAEVESSRRVTLQTLPSRLKV